MLVSLITFIVCCINPNAISMIYAISGPLIAMILFIMPTLSTYLIPALKPLAFHRKSDYADRGYPVRIGNVL